VPFLALQLISGPFFFFRFDGCVGGIDAPYYQHFCMRFAFFLIARYIRIDSAELTSRILILKLVSGVTAS
jgi:hypothetical protein